jgi:hypothetical protein
MALDQAITALHETLEHQLPGEQWRSALRRRLAAVCEALAEDGPHFRDGWLSARDAGTERDRRALLARLRALTTGVPQQAASSYAELRRLGVDLEHYRQRLHDLAYDAVGLELGGSE